MLMLAIGAVFFFLACWAFCWVGFSLVAASRGYTLDAVHRLFTEVASLVAEHGALGRVASVVTARGLSSCGSSALKDRVNSCDARAWLLHSIWDLPRSGLEPISSALTGILFTTEPPKKLSVVFLSDLIYLWGLYSLKFCFFLKRI